MTPASSLANCMCCKDMQDDHLHFMTAEGSRCGQVKAKAAKCPAEQITAATLLSDTSAAEYRLATDSSRGLAGIEKFHSNWHWHTKALQAHRHGQLCNPVEEEDKRAKKYEAAHI